MEFLRFACMTNCQSKKSIEQKPTRDECVFQSTDCNIEQLKLELNTVKTFTCLFTRLLFFACFPNMDKARCPFDLSELEQMSQVTCTSTWDFLINKLEQNFYFELLASWQIYPTLNWALLTCELGKRQKVALNVWNLLKASTKPWAIQNNVIQFAICCQWIYCMENWCRNIFHERRSWFYKWSIKKIIEQRKEKRTVSARDENDTNRCI